MSEFNLMKEEGSCCAQSELSSGKDSMLGNPRAESMALSVSS